MNENPAGRYGHTRGHTLSPTRRAAAFSSWHTIGDSTHTNNNNNNNPIDLHHCRKSGHSSIHPSYFQVPIAIRTR